MKALRLNTVHLLQFRIISLLLVQAKWLMIRCPKPNGLLFMTDKWYGSSDNKCIFSEVWHTNATHSWHSFLIQIFSYEVVIKILLSPEIESSPVCGIEWLARAPGSKLSVKDRWRAGDSDCAFALADPLPLGFAHMVSFANGGSAKMKWIQDRVTIQVASNLPLTAKRVCNVFQI